MADVYPIFFTADKYISLEDARKLVANLGHIEDKHEKYDKMTEELRKITGMSKGRSTALLTQEMLLLLDEAYQDSYDGERTWMAYSDQPENERLWKRYPYFVSLAMEKYAKDHMEDAQNSEEDKDILNGLAAKMFVWLSLQPLVESFGLGYCPLLTRTPFSVLVDRLALHKDALTEVSTFS